ncbi:MAG: adenylate/guanylate cyclase domain-containing protein [Verrucomicrobia bacterium]|nr:adenylate/guanylate cyclase domain-containing protein [Verrucomicrobiota bacterium]
MFRFRRFSVRLLVLLLGLLFAALATTYLLVSRANESNARAHAEANLELAAGIFDETVAQRIEFLAGSASVMTGDYAIRDLLRDEKPDGATLSSTLQSYTQRVGAPVIALLDPEGALLANSAADMENENLGPFRYLIRQATAAEMPKASGFSYLNQALHVLVVVPLYAPYPNVFAWFGLAFPIDEAFAKKIKATSRVEVTFVSTEGPDQPSAPNTPPGRVLTTTLPEAAALLVARAAVENMQRPVRVKALDLPADHYVTLFKFQDMLGEDAITVVLQRPLSAELTAAKDLENYLVLISLAALAVATLVALWISRGVSQPVLQLADYTKHVAAGDYTRRIDLHREDELGQLAVAMNAMSAGLAERDLVRDLLDKNVSPEVAAQLMRDGGAALGGEEREVTILFADLRGFTTLSEKLGPRDLLTLLNRYLDRMSTEIERQGGVIDKFIGDAIMALFGAPVAQGDAAARALAAALAMERALASLNAELAAEGRPPLALGVGVNTAGVIAGNIGSHRRLNYSVIGDGVNIASRLQSLTRTPEYRTSIITSAATLAAVRGRNFATRALGTVPVKGRAEPVEIFAVDG